VAVVILHVNKYEIKVTRKWSLAFYFHKSKFHDQLSNSSWHSVSWCWREG